MVILNETSPSRLLLALLCVCLERCECLFSQRHDCRGYGRLDPWPFVAARAGQKGLPFRLLLAFVRRLERFCSTQEEEKQNALRADVILGIEGVSFLLDRTVKGVCQLVRAMLRLDRMSTIGRHFFDPTLLVFFPFPLLFLSHFPGPCWWSALCNMRERWYGANEMIC